MPHIETVHLKSGKVRYQAAYRDARGREHAKRFDTKREAKAWLAREAADMQRGSWRDPRLGRITFAAWVDYYLDGARHKRATTLARDRHVLRTNFLPELGPRPLGAITPLEVRSVVRVLAERLAPATVRTNYGVLRAVFSAAVEADVIATSPCRGITLAPDEHQDGGSCRPRSSSVWPQRWRRSTDRSSTSPGSWGCGGRRSRGCGWDGSTSWPAR